MKSIYYDMIKTLGEDLIAKTIPADKHPLYLTMDNELVSMENAKKTYTSFSGCDIVISFDGVVIGEANSIKFASFEKEYVHSINLNSGQYFDMQLLPSHPIAVKIDFTLFDRTHSLKDISNIIISYANEYGQHAYRTITGLKQILTTGDHSIDSATSEYSIYCCAENITEMAQRRYVKYNESYSGDLFNEDSCHINSSKELFDICRAFIGKKNFGCSLNELDGILRDKYYKYIETFSIFNGFSVLTKSEKGLLIDKIIVCIGGCNYLLDEEVAQNE